MSSLATGCKRVSTSCTQLAGIRLVYQLRMLQLSADLTLRVGPTTTLLSSVPRCVVMPALLTGIVYLLLLIQFITAGTSGFSWSSITRAWLTERTQTLTGAQVVKQFWQTNRLFRVFASVATAWSLRRHLPSGTSKSLITLTACLMI